jgi:hypothetical protein
MYEASDIVTIGAAHELTLGVKPICFCMDSLGSVNHNEPVDEIDETENQ